MTPERIQQVEELYHAALKREPGQRAAFLSEACASDSELLAEVESLIEAHEHDDGLMDSPAYEGTVDLPPDSQGDSLIGRSIGHYKLLSLLGKGGMGEVYLAADQRLGREVALKLLPPDFNQDPERLARFRREASMAAALHHPNICGIHEIHEADGLNYISMEYIKGLTLKERLSAEPMEIEAVLDIGIQIADALNEARKKNIIHRDIKSANILVTDTNQVKVLDFGLAKPYLSDDGNDSEVSTITRLTEPGTLMGTVAYMSPEQALGRPLDHRTDIFSFGVVLYEMLAGRLPFSGNSQQELIDALVHKSPPPLARYNDNTPDELIRVVNKMLEKDREHRYQSVHEVWVDLRRIKGESESKGLVVGKRPIARRWKTAGVGVVAVLITISALLFWRSSLVPSVEAKSLVALPCKVYGEQDVAYLTDAIPSTLSTLLGQLEGVETMVPPTSLEVESVRGDLNKIALAYKVNTFVMTSINVDSGRLVLNVQIVDSQSRRLLWGKEFDGQRKDYIDLVKRAAEGIRQTLRTGATPQAFPTGLAASSEAELAFRQGKYYSNRYNNQHQTSDFDVSFSAFKRALELDPKLANAAAEIAMLNVFKIESGAPKSEINPEIESWAQKALRIDPNCARGVIALVAAEELNPHSSSGKLIGYALRAAHLDAQDSMAALSVAKGLRFCSVGLALAAAREAQRLDPLYLYAGMNIASVLHSLGRTSEALEELNHILDIEPDMPFAVYAKALMLAELARAQEAASLLPRIQAMVSEGRLPAVWYLNAQYAVAVETGDNRTAALALKGVMSVVNDPKTSSFDLTDFATDFLPFLTRHGNYEPALRILSRCAEGGLAPPYDLLMLNPHMAPLRSDGRFQEIAARSRAQLEEVIQILQEAKSRDELPPYLEAPMADLVKKLDIGR